MQDSITVERFPMRRSRAIWIIPEDAAAWLVVAGDHGWLFGTREDADRDAAWLGTNLGLPVRVVAP